MRRRVAKRVLAAGVGALALALAVVAWWPELLAGALALALHRAGFPDAGVTVTAAGLSETEISLRLDAAGENRIERLIVAHPLDNLLRGRVARVAVEGLRLRLPLEGIGAAGGGNGGDLPALPAEVVTIEDAVVRLPGGDLTVRGMAEATGDSVTAIVAVEAGDVGAVAALLGVESAVRGQGRFSAVLRGGRQGDTWRLSPDGCATLTLDGLAVAGERVALPKGLCLRAPEDGAALTLSGAGTALRLIAEAERVALPNRALAAEGVVVTAGLEGRRLTADATVKALRGTRSPPPFAPLALTAAAERDGDGPLGFTATARGPAGVVIEATGTHDLAAGTGNAEVRLTPVTFRPGGAGPAQIFPRHGARVSGTSGRVAGKGRFDWGGGLRSSGELLLENLSATVSPIAVTGLSGLVRLSSLVPPVVPAGQVLAVKRLDVGLPLTDGVLHVGLKRSGRLDVDRAEWRWAGGLVRAKPFEMPLDAPKGTVELEAEGLDLGAVLAIAAVDGLHGEGTLNGTLPLRIAGDVVRLVDGVLEAAGPGTLRYDPQAPPAFLEGDPGSPTGLLRGALTDFRYDTLKLTVNGTAGADMALRLAIHGANPTFYDGYPVALNLNVSGALDRILRQSLDTYRIPDAVRDRMMEFEKSAP
ncbi:MAG TPA: YdbH domain-containing protein [Azospirillum sp.]